MAWKMTRAQQVGALGVALLLLIPPISSKVSSDFVLEPGRDAHLRAEVPGALRQVLVRQRRSGSRPERHSLFWKTPNWKQTRRCSPSNLQWQTAIFVLHKGGRTGIKPPMR